MLSTLRVIAARVRGFLRPADQDQDFAEELEAHLAMAEEDKIRQGMSPEEARRRARVELGGVTQLREATREARGLPWLDTWWLDLKLGLRMLRKSWGLTLVGGLAMTLAIGVGVFAFWFLEMVFFPSLPLDEGDRVVALQTWDDRASRRHDTARLDLERWRDSLRSVEELGAFQTAVTQLDLGEGQSMPVSIAEISAAGFQLARVPPLMGRPLLAADEDSGAPPVVVIGYEVWQTRFAADPAVVGKVMRFGETPHTVVGVMPEGFSFPTFHSYWRPLRMGQAEYLRDAGPQGVVFARLASGYTLEQLEGELGSLGLLSPAALDSGKELRPRAVSYPFAFTGDFDADEAPWIVKVILFLVILLLVPPCANIAILVYARTITRQEEFASRFALGASRGRIVGQLFIELLVLAGGAAMLALVLVRLIGAHLHQRSVEKASDGLPFWMDFTLSPRTVLFAAVLALLAATIAGMIPAFKATGRQMEAGFRVLGSGTVLRLGGTWTALVITQVALTLAALPSAVEMGWGTLREGVLGPGFAAEEYLTARVTVDRETVERETVKRETAKREQSDSETRPFRRQVAAIQEMLLAEMQAEPEVLQASLASSVPGDEPWAAVEVEGVQLAGGALVESRDLVQYNHVDAAFFDVFANPLLIGRDFQVGDFTTDSRALIVDQTFVRLMLGEGNPLGRRVRYARAVGEHSLESAQLETWHEIVGVVADLPAHANHGTIYHPLVPGSVSAASLALRTGIPPASLADRLRDVSTALHPALGLEEVLPLDQIYRDQQIGNNVGALGLVMVTFSVLLLSAAGIYALMSFTVNQRRREIGIRSALGAPPQRVLMGIFRRALLQVGVGAVVGSSIAALIAYYLPMDQLGGWKVPGIIPAAAVFMMLVAMLAAAGPVRRGLRVDPIEELREG